MFLPYSPSYDSSNIICVIHSWKMAINDSWWRHQIETSSSLLAICVGKSPVTGEFPAQRPVTRSFDVSLICAWINGSVNNREAGDLRHHRTHYDVTVMWRMTTIIVYLGSTLRNIYRKYAIDYSWYHLHLIIWLVNDKVHVQFLCQTCHAFISKMVRYLY